MQRVCQCQARHGTCFADPLIWIRQLHRDFFRQCVQDSEKPSLRHVFETGYSLMT
jgi:hypothetical protein